MVVPQLVKNAISWTGPDLIELPFKVVIYSLLLVELSKMEFGLLSLAMLIMSYQALVQFGSIDWLMFELPKRWAAKEDMTDLLNSSLTFNFCSLGLFYLEYSSKI